jgi:hypothetical protein
VFVVSNHRFAEYATSGAFNLTLARNQVSALAMIAAGASGYSVSEVALERKGLVEAVAKPSTHDADRIEFRPTHAGLLCLGLLVEAGLTNGAPDPVAAELAAMRAELASLRHEARDQHRLAWSAMARREETEAELVAAQRRIKDLETEQGLGLKLKPQFARDAAMPMVRKRDYHPELSDAELRAAIGEPA